MVPRICPEVVSAIIASSYSSPRGNVEGEIDVFFRNDRVVQRDNERGMNMFSFHFLERTLREPRPPRRNKGI